ncbi:MAG: carbamoyltransferase HypF [Candidatus Omnitrophica bacterium]|nr:carbamoyltransferase HypF [Candidatus Omnitrophota bacterium]
MKTGVRRTQVIINGAVQGVGFRPFLFRLAEEMQLPGWVKNSSQGVIVEVEGPPNRLEWFVQRIQSEKPPHAIIQSIQCGDLDPAGFTGFEIRNSSNSGTKTALLLPDLATCRECLKEIFDPADHRYLYPFTNCTHCGPRFSIVQSLPYDRPNTSMRRFEMCPECRAEYEDPLNRRFHAQPNACPACGPQVEAWDHNGHVLSQRHDAILETVWWILEGKTAAVKGLGGFHLMAAAGDPDAVKRLRRRKFREEKPFAVMFPNLDAVREVCHVSELEEKILLSPESPIVLLKRREKSGLSDIFNEAAPRNPYLGVMLPYTPLHHILLRELNCPVIATSGNRSDEPICIDEHEALERLRGVADGFLVHNRPIVRHVDDSIVRIMAGREMILRRARGYAPLPVEIHENMPKTLAVGAHLKNTIALNAGHNVFISQHIGDLETEPAYHAFREVIDSFQSVYETKPDVLVSDLHPDYLSTQYARSLGLSHLQVQHHYAHVLSCMAENQIAGSVLGVSWDGTGFGPDGTVWGGEFLSADRHGFQRAAHFRTFPLPSGDRAVKQPRRTALGMLYERFGDAIFERSDLAPICAFSKPDLHILRDMLHKQLNSPLTSSAGRLFDAVASLLDIRQTVSFEGQAAMELEFAINDASGDSEDDALKIEQGYLFDIIKPENNDSLIVDWAPMLDALLEDIQSGRSQSYCSIRFHNGLAEVVVSIAKRLKENRVVLTGGCFQNKYLCERTIQRLREEGFEPFWHRHVPPNDGGISLGQIAAAVRDSKEK